MTRGWDPDLERMRNRVAMPYVKDQVQGAAMKSFKQITTRMMRGQLGERVPPNSAPLPRGYAKDVEP